MTIKLEKQFFDTFGIKTQTGIGLVKFKEPHYPQITDKIILKLICYMTVQQYQLVICNKKTIEDLKEHILKKCIKDYSKDEYLKHQVQAIFEGERCTDKII